MNIWIKIICVGIFITIMTSYSYFLTQIPNPSVTIDILLFQHLLTDKSKSKVSQLTKTYDLVFISLLIKILICQHLYD